MKIILKEDVHGLGYKDDILTVKDGYGRNFLIPTGKAILATPSAEKVLAENLKQRAHKLAKIKADAEALAIYKAAQEKPRKKVRRNDDARKTVDPYAEVRSYLTRFSVDNAQKIFNKWVELEQLLLVKFIDGNVKAQNADGSFVTNEHTDCIPAKITQPGYTDTWKAVVAEKHGTTIEVR